MKITKLVMVAVDSTACFIRPQSSLRFISARMMAPLAPIAPPSVGVATPMKIVPSTRKISTSGGIRQVNTLSASAPPFSVRASGGSAGAASGLTMDTIST